MRKAASLVRKSAVTACAGAMALCPSAFAQEVPEQRPEGQASVIDFGENLGVQVGAQLGYSSAGSSSQPREDDVGAGRPEAVVVGFSPHSCVPIWSGLPDRGGFPLDYSFDDGGAGGNCVSFVAPAPADQRPAQPGAPEVSAEELLESAVDEAISLAVAPELVVAPNRAGITGLRSYFWLRATPAPVSATASVPGLSVTAEASPVRYVWNFGEGGERSTSHSGRAWTRSRPGNVSHFYETKGLYVISAQVIYQARYRVGSGAWRALGYFSTSDARPYRVREVRAYLTNPDD